MGADYIPERDSKAANWMRVFARGIAASPALYHVSPVEAADLVVLVQAYRDALADATRPSTRTKVTVRIKNDARQATQTPCRQFARLIKFNDAIADSDKIAVGLKPAKQTRTRRMAPQESPCIAIKGATNGIHHLHVRQDLVLRPGVRSGKRGGKPFGAICMQLFVAIGDTMESDPEQARFVGSFTTANLRVPHVSQDAGKVATYFARWAGRRGDVGRWSLPQSMHIAA